MQNADEKNTHEEKQEGTVDLQSASKAAETGIPNDDVLSVAPTSEDKQNNKSLESERAIAASSHRHLVADKNQMSEILRHRVYNLAKKWMQLLAIVASTIFAGVISVVVGLGSWTLEPQFTFVRQHPVISVAIGGFFTLISIVAWLIARGPAPQDHELPQLSQHTRRLVFATITSTTSSILVFALLAVVYIRPSWCPTTLCPPVFDQNTIHDDHLEVRIMDLQSEWYAIPNNPASYSLKNLPTGIGARQIDSSGSSLPYGVVLGVRNWQQGGYDVIIERVNLIIDKVPAMPYPLNVWTEGTPPLYPSDYPFQAVYSDQRPGAVLPASYFPIPSNQIGLRPGETDILVVQVVSMISVDLQFHLQMIYHVPNESQPHTLTLSNVFFEVVFSKTSNWHPYQLQDGHFVPV